jgi:hypothetical protein
MIDRRTKILLAVILLQVLGITLLPEDSIGSLRIMLIVTSVGLSAELIYRFLFRN